MGVWTIRIYVFTWFVTSCVGEYTDFTTLLWLESAANVDPADVWYDDVSVYNNVTNTTLQTLQTGSTQGFRNTMIDAWSTYVPDKIRVSFLNANGDRLFFEEFNSTGSTMADWFSKSRSFTTGVGQDYYVLNSSFTSYKVSFSHENSVWGVRRYRAVVIPNYSGVTYFLVHNKDGPLILPAPVLNATTRCRVSYDILNIFAFNSSSVTNLNHGFCSAICRENNYPTGAVHGTYCSCLSGNVEGSQLTACNTTCEGNTSQTCGGIGTYPPEAVIFDTVSPEIDVTQFDVPFKEYETFTVSGSDEVSYGTNRIINGFRFTVPASALPRVVRFEMSFHPGDCSITTPPSTTIQETFYMAVDNHNFTLAQPINVRCINFTLRDDSYDLFTFPVDITTIAVKDKRFVTASIFAIEAAWWVEPNVTEDQCECECWAYNLLYGDSPYNNLTYSEIEDALRNVTDKIERELSVNKSELSSTIRSKTSAEDNRKSATAVGYTLGVALLTISIGGIVLADVPKLFRNMKMMRENLNSRFCRSKSSQPDVTLTNTANRTSRVS